MVTCKAQTPKQQPRVKRAIFFVCPSCSRSCAVMLKTACPHLNHITKRYELFINTAIGRFRTQYPLHNKLLPSLFNHSQSTTDRHHNLTFYKISRCPSTQETLGSNNTVNMAPKVQATEVLAIQRTALHHRTWSSPFSHSPSVQCPTANTVPVATPS